MTSQEYIQELIQELKPADPVLLSMQLDKLVTIAQKEETEKLNK